MASSIIESSKMTRLLTVLEEATRSTQKAYSSLSSRQKMHCVERPVSGTTSCSGGVALEKRRSCEKRPLTWAVQRPIAWVDLEGFKGHSYPDLLISVLIKTMAEFKKSLETAAIAPANKTSFWKGLVGGKPSRPPFDKKACAGLIATISGHLDALNKQLHSADDAEIEATQERGATTKEAMKATASGSIKAGGLGASSTLDGATEQAASAQTKYTESFRRSKVEFLRRHVMDYQSVFTQMAGLSDGDSFLILDDLYHLRRTEQPLVVDYLHSIAKGNGLWLKIGTIKHRSSWYVHGSPPQGMKLGDDADEIDLDLTLEKYSLAKGFLRKILQNLAKSVELSDSLDFLTDTGLDRLVLASGGVARDFLSIFRRASPWRESEALPPVVVSVSRRGCQCRSW